MPGHESQLRSSWHFVGGVSGLAAGKQAALGKVLPTLDLSLTWIEERKSSLVRVLPSFTPLGYTGPR